MPRKNVDSYSPGKIKNRFPRNRCVKFLDSPPPRYRSEAPQTAQTLLRRRMMR
ncbi:hypothetical protein DPMN_163821, partial [Dreissena polymorpha]